MGFLALIILILSLFSAVFVLLLPIVVGWFGDIGGLVVCVCCQCEGLYHEVSAIDRQVHRSSLAPWSSLIFPRTLLYVFSQTLQAAPMNIQPAM